MVLTAHTGAGLLGITKSADSAGTLDSREIEARRDDSMQVSRSPLLHVMPSDASGSGAGLIGLDGTETQEHLFVDRLVHVEPVSKRGYEFGPTQVALPAHGW